MPYPFCFISGRNRTSMKFMCSNFSLHLIPSLTVIRISMAKYLN